MRRVYANLAGREKPAWKRQVTECIDQWDTCAASTHSSPTCEPGITENTVHKTLERKQHNNIESTDLIKYAESYVNFHSQMMNVFLQRFKSFVYFSSFLFNELVSTWCLQSSRTGRNQQHAAGASSSSDAARSQMTMATCFRKFAERSLLSLWFDLCSSPRLKLNNKPIQSQSLLLQSTPGKRPLKTFFFCKFFPLQPFFLLQHWLRNSSNFYGYL